MLNQRWRTQILRAVAIETREATPECNAISIGHISCRIYELKARKIREFAEIVSQVQGRLCLKLFI